MMNALLSVVCDVYVFKLAGYLYGPKASSLAVSHHSLAKQNHFELIIFTFLLLNNKPVLNNTPLALV